MCPVSAIFWPLSLSSVANGSSAGAVDLVVAIVLIIIGGNSATYDAA